MKYRWWAIIAFGIFVISIVIGLVRPTSVLGLISDEAATLQQLSQLIDTFPPLLEVLFIFIKIAVALLVPAAFIEIMVTPLLLPK